MLELVTRNWLLKLLAVALAFALWVAVTGEEYILQDFAVPLDISVGEAYTLAGAPPRTVTVRLRGPESRLRSLDNLRMSFGIDLTDAIPGERTVQLSETALEGLPRGFDVDLITPVQLSLTVDELMEKDLPVSATLAGQPPQGYAYYGARVIPRTITVEGPRSEVEELETIRTDPINLDGRSAPFTVSVGAVPATEGLRIVGARSLEVRVDVDTAPVDAVVTAVPVIFSGQALEANVDPLTLDVTLFGPPALVAEMDPERVRAVADIEGLTPQDKPYHLSPRIEFKDLTPRDMARIIVKSVSRETVAVTISDRRISQ